MTKGIGQAGTDSAGHASDLQACDPIEPMGRRSGSTGTKVRGPLRRSVPDRAAPHSGCSPWPMIGLPGPMAERPGVAGPPESPRAVGAPTGRRPRRSTRPAQASEPPWRGDAGPVRAMPDDSDRLAMRSQQAVPSRTTARWSGPCPPPDEGTTVGRYPAGCSRETVPRPTHLPEGRSRHPDGRDVSHHPWVRVPRAIGGPPLVSAPTISVIVPAMNEAANLPHVLPRIPTDVLEVILVDGNSTDDTVAVAAPSCPPCASSSSMAGARAPRSAPASRPLVATSS